MQSVSIITLFANNIFTVHLQPQLSKKSCLRKFPVLQYYKLYIRVYTQQMHTHMHTNMHTHTHTYEHPHNMNTLICATFKVVCLYSFLSHYSPQKEGKPALVLACEGGHVECVKLLMTHPNINKNATYGESRLCALHRCTYI